ncbi:hypothetical protein CCACVL1_17167 [Corchorus capsularis]|uniref:Uncharacterized protein n=1 Tax=Corchorus capsularis TaxID=210143 RepID=A0A1R3HTL6_COCAP|nr:hypothetical protein CCACVL1_17167 [Corchorus capsularis]
MLSPQPSNPTSSEPQIPPDPESTTASDDMTISPTASPSTAIISVGPSYKYPKPANNLQTNHIPTPSLQTSHHVFNPTHPPNSPSSTTTIFPNNPTRCPPSTTFLYEPISLTLSSILRNLFPDSSKPHLASNTPSPTFVLQPIQPLGNRPNSAFTNFTRPPYRRLPYPLRPIPPPSAFQPFAHIHVTFPAIHTHHSNLSRPLPQTRDQFIERGFNNFIFQSLHYSPHLFLVPADMLKFEVHLAEEQFLHLEGRDAIYTLKLYAEPNVVRQENQTTLMTNPNGSVNPPISEIPSVSSGRRQAIVMHEKEEPYVEAAQALALVQVINGHSEVRSSEGEDLNTFSFISFDEGMAATIAIITGLCGFGRKKSPPLDPTADNIAATTAAETAAQPKSTPVETEENIEELMKELPPPPAMQRTLMGTCSSNNLIGKSASTRKLSLSTLSVKHSRSISMNKFREKVGEKLGDKLVKPKAPPDQDSLWRKTIILGEKCKISDRTEDVVAAGGYYPMTRTRTMSTISLSRANSLKEQETVPPDDQNDEKAAETRKDEGEDKKTKEGEDKS